MFLSVNTNVGAQVALQNLNATNALLSITQNRINTGKKWPARRTTGPSGLSPKANGPTSGR